MSAKQADPREKLASILTYIHQVEKLRKKAAYTVPGEFFAVAENALVGLPGVSTNLVTGPDDVWIQIDRLIETPPPSPPEELSPHIRLSRSPSKPPELLHPQESEDTSAADQAAAHLIAEQLFEAYCKESWSPWAEAEAPIRRSIAVYNKLFSVQQAMALEGAETPLEMVIGIGMAHWSPTGSGKRVAHPLITLPVEVSLDSGSFALRVQPRAADPTIELDCYTELECRGVHQVEAFWKAFLGSRATNLTPFEPESYEPALRTAVSFLDSGGRYVPRLNSNGSGRLDEDHLVVVDEWTLFARRRSQHPFIQDLQRLQQSLETLEHVPAAVRSLVVEADDSTSFSEPPLFRGLSGAAGIGNANEELYFPLPYNDEQTQIVAGLHRSPGVVCQGPPGTGKSHTIANIVCHYLAQGKKVLVSSKGETALEVLREKIPEEIRPLCVALLSDEREGMRQFEAAIEEIAKNLSDINPLAVEQQIAAVEHKINVIHAEMAAVDASITAIAQQHLMAVRWRGRECRPEELALYVSRNAEAHQWLDDLVPVDSHPPLTEAEVTDLRAALDAVGDDVDHIGSDIPAPNAVPSADDLAATHSALQRANAVSGSIRSGALPPMVDGASEDDARQLLTLLSAEQALHVGCSELGIDPLGPLRALALADPADNPTAAALVPLLEEMLRLERERQAITAAAVSAPDTPASAEVLEAITRLSQGKRAFSIPIGKKDARDFIDQCRIATLQPSSTEEWQLVLRALLLRRSAAAALSKYNAMAAEAGLPPQPSDVEVALPPLARICRQAAALMRSSTHYPQQALRLARKLFGDSFAPSAPVYSAHGMAMLRTFVEENLTLRATSTARANVQTWADRVEKCSGPEAAQLKALWPQIGTLQSVDSLISTFGHVRDRLTHLRSLQPYFITILRCSDHLRKAGANNLAGRLLCAQTARQSIGSDWVDAWFWAAARTFTSTLHGQDRLRELEGARQQSQEALSRSYKELVAARTWLGVYRHAPPSVRQALQAYLNSVQNIGSGTGVRAIRYRQDARTAMQRAYAAVPCWILPHWRVSEAMPAEIGLFDLVIIDEGSQSDLWALPVLLRGKKLLVVGDHKQVSPSAVGMEETKIRELRARFLADQVHGAMMTPERSIYDLARVVFADRSVMLKEHFRCVPAIIEFSNREIYESSIRPLRLPPRNQRLDPPLVDVYIKGAARRGDTNPAEAIAVVDLVREMIDTKAARGRTIGVVTLMGSQQDRLIKQMMNDRIPIEHQREHDIAVGTPPVFQGRERDIMLMSMVVTPDNRGAASGLVYEQRINVAASRARDRMILVRSVAAEDLTAANDIRRKLIAHFARPFSQDQAVTENQRAQCESPFEEEVFNFLTDRGYRVTPQVPVSGYRIDMVVEGAAGRRLAVECDGDRFHGPERWDSDMRRQRVLERAGWTFWRCFASTYTLRRSEVEMDLLETLQRMGIEPLGSAASSTSLWAEQRELDAVELLRGLHVHEAVAGSAPPALV